MVQKCSKFLAAESSHDGDATSLEKHLDAWLEVMATGHTYPWGTAMVFHIGPYKDMGVP